MDCLRFEKLVQAHLDADLAPAQRLRMDAHAARCSTCAGLLSDYAAIFDALNGLERDTAPADLELAVLSRLHRHASVAERLRHLVTPPRLTIPAQMAVAALSMLLAVWIGFAHENSLRGELERLATWSYATIAGSVADLQSGFLAANWPLIRSSAETILQALRLVLGAQPATVFSMLLGCIVLFAGLAHGRRARGGRHANLHLV